MDLIYVRLSAKSQTHSCSHVLSADPLTRLECSCLFPVLRNCRTKYLGLLWPQNSRWLQSGQNESRFKGRTVRFKFVDENVENLCGLGSGKEVLDQIA